ncbi:MAG: AraC family transcriptional regulator [Proteobacteria bacterium]|nr:AraC family transcriptional regulator [Pseudomonadota bacterium]
MPTSGGQLLINLFEPELRHWESPGRLGRTVGPVGLQGALTRPVLIDTAQKRAVCGVAFRSGGLTAFHGVSAVQFTDSIVDAADVWGDSARQLLSTLSELDDLARRLDAIEGFLLERLCVRSEEDPLLRDAADRLQAGEGVATVRAAAGLSQRALHELFERRVGLRPKLFARIERFVAALDAAPNRASWAELAIEAGFADQAHLSREFASLTGAPPTRHRPVEREPRHAQAPEETFKKDGRR